MRIFVASWFFPPNSSSEGFVTYKLLRNSSHSYDVVCSTSDLWGYKARMEVEEPRIKIIPVKTAELDEWKEQAIKIFEAEHAKRPYDAIMTRSMPPEALEVGLAVKKRHPDVLWIASTGDPIANNPYVVNAMEKFLPPEDGRDEFLADLPQPSVSWRRDWTKSINSTIRLEAELKVLQEKSLAAADAVICPSDIQRRFMRSGNRVRRFEVVPHSFDASLYSRASGYDPGFAEGKINLVYLGYSDQLRSLMPMVQALRALYVEYPELATKLCFHIYGNYPADVSDYIQSFQLPAGLCIPHGNCTYWESLAVMKAADWLVHIDAYFPSLSETGGSIFFAGKLADYLGSGKPVFALTGAGSPADCIVRNYGGVICLPWDGGAIRGALASIARGKMDVSVDLDFAAKYDARKVAAEFDSFLGKLFAPVECSPVGKPVLAGKAIPPSKTMTVCVPCYNAAATLRRCLDSILAVKRPERLDVIVVDDGSTDKSAEIAVAYVNEHPGNVRLLRKPNGGHGSGINAGIDIAAGRYFRVVDSDDWVDAAALSGELDYLETHEKDAPDICYSNYRLVDSTTGAGSDWVLNWTPEYGRIYKFDDLDTAKVYFTMAGSAFRTQVLRDSGLRCMEHCFYTDSEYILKPIPYVRTAVFLKAPVYRYWRGQEGQSVAFSSFVKNYDNHYAVVRSLVDFYNTAKFPSVQKKYFFRLLKEHLVTHYRIMEEFDDDKKRGRARKRDFDEYLKKAMPELYKWSLRRPMPAPCCDSASQNMDGGTRKKLKRLVKMMLPYSVVRLYQKKHYGV